MSRVSPPEATAPSVSLSAHYTLYSGIGNSYTGLAAHWPRLIEHAQVHGHRGQRHDAGYFFYPDRIKSAGTDLDDPSSNLTYVVFQVENGGLGV